MNDASPDLHTPPSLSQRTSQSLEDLKDQLAATQAELDRALDTISNLSSTIAFLRKPR